MNSVDSLVGVLNNHRGKDIVISIPVHIKVGGKILTENAYGYLELEGVSLKDNTLDFKLNICESLYLSND